MGFYAIAKKGAALAEPLGPCSDFNYRRFITTRKEWIAEMNGLRAHSDMLLDEYYPHAYEGERVGPVGEIKISKHDGFVYTYLVSERGHWESKFFTHEVIAGEFTTIPPYGGF